MILTPCLLYTPEAMMEGHTSCWTWRCTIDTASLYRLVKTASRLHHVGQVTDDRSRSLAGYDVRINWWTHFLIRPGKPVHNFAGETPIFKHDPRYFCPHINRLFHVQGQW